MPALDKNQNAGAEFGFHDVDSIVNISADVHELRPAHTRRYGAGHDPLQILRAKEDNKVSRVDQPCTQVSIRITDVAADLVEVR